MRDRSRIVVLGAGYSGLTCFLELQSRLERSHDLLLVNSDRYHWFTTELHTYAAGEQEDAVRIPLARAMARPGSLVVGRVERIDPTARRVYVGRDPIDYDLLVVALGSEPEYYDLPGVAENSLTVGTWQRAARLRDRIRALLQGESGPAPHVVVAGGGLTGVEVAGELADEGGERLRLTIVEAAPEIMAGFDPELIKVARHVLRAKGVSLRTDAPISQVQPGVVEFRDGERLPFDLLIWTGGVRGSRVLVASGLAVTPKGRGRVDTCLRAEGHPQIYLIGDAAALLDLRTGRELPPSAQYAVQMGRAVGRNIVRRLGGAVEEPFLPRTLGSFASLGRLEGVGQIGHEQFTGVSAMVIKNLIEAHHAWETGGGVMPLVNRLLLGPRRYLRGRPRLFRRLTGERVVSRPQPRNHPAPPGAGPI